MYKGVKRCFDVLFAAVGVFILSPVFIVVSIFIKAESPGPVIFKQQRLGLDGKVFYIYKFRSMCVGAEKKGNGVYCKQGDNRVTRIGKFIRATSIDELPQFINILKGDMSLIGFRPPLTYHPWEISKYTDEQKKMFSVRPGITGWAQINGRKGVEWNERIKLNAWYAENISFLLDFKIFLSTIVKVLTNVDNHNGETPTVKTTKANRGHNATAAFEDSIPTEGAVSKCQ